MHILKIGVLSALTLSAITSDPAYANKLVLDQEFITPGYGASWIQSTMLLRIAPGGAIRPSSYRPSQLEFQASSLESNSLVRWAGAAEAALLFNFTMTYHMAGLAPLCRPPPPTLLPHQISQWPTSLGGFLHLAPYCLCRFPCRRHLGHQGRRFGRRDLVRRRIRNHGGLLSIQLFRRRRGPY